MSPPGVLIWLCLAGLVSLSGSDAVSYLSGSSSCPALSYTSSARYVGASPRAIFTHHIKNMEYDEDELKITKGAACWKPMTHSAACNILPPRPVAAGSAAGHLLAGTFLILRPQLLPCSQPYPGCHTGTVEQCSSAHWFNTH